MGETTVVKVDARGRIQLPKALMEALCIEGGDLIRITVENLREKRESGNPLIAAEVPAFA